ncbi:hypothetical protein Y032_0094g2744 [Ancylostoma ceylanicum]|uniref:Uncharacterized protein n=2 Tax=Ancylostoma ceylanicum TaxID=53326 RepID=A0A016TL86_9BILA|nr:hypothetical protein Y032_0094g2744 [Ancylostoma ceylanicum]
MRFIDLSMIYGSIKVISFRSAIACGGYLKAMNKLYQSSLILFCKQWKEENCSVKDCQHILNRIDSLLRHSQKTLLNS